MEKPLLHYHTLVPHVLKISTRLFLQSNPKEVTIYNKISRMGYLEEHLEDLKAIMVVPKSNFKTYLSNLCICSSL